MISDKNKPLISVIIPVYNVYDYLRKSIESVLNQTYEELEVILIDDGSTDLSGNVCDEYKNRDERVKVLHQKNAGLSAARNSGLNIADGQYVFFLDSDDWLETDCIETLYELILKYQVSIAQGGESEAEEQEASMDSKSFLLSANYRTMAWGKLYSMEECRDKLFFPVGKIHEDEAVVYKVIYEAKRIAFTSKHLYHYNRREDSITSKSDRNTTHIDKVLFEKERVKYFKERGDQELVYWATRSYAFDLLSQYLEPNKLEKQKRKVIKQEYKKCIPILMKDPVLKLHTKIVLYICTACPQIWKWM